MNKIKLYWAKYPQQILLGITVFLFLAGVVQYGLGLSYVLRLTPVFLAAIAAISIIVWDAAPRVKAALALFIVALGFILEIIGVHTGVLFGDYTYGSALGFRLWGVPITIGLTWLLVTLPAWQIVQYGKLNIYQKFMLAGLLVVMFDLILEQFAVAYGLWAWKGGEIPLYNYVCWFGISLLIFAIYNKFTKKSLPSLYIVFVLPVMASFFWLMLLFV